MHDPLQGTRPDEQTSAQVPEEQTWPDGQAVVQLPQCCGSVCVFVQNALAPEPHAFGVSGGHEQLLDEQVCPSGQTMPHPPQLLASLEVVAQ